MAVLESIRKFFIAPAVAEPEVIIAAAECEYYIRPLTKDHLLEVLRLNVRCFRNGDNYTRFTFEYLLNDSRTLSYRMISDTGDLVAFAFVMVNDKNVAHLTTIGVAPEHRRRGIANRMLEHIDGRLKEKEASTVMLEVRVSNTSAQELYRRAGYAVVQRIARYYNNGEDCFLMVKSLV